MKHVAKLCIGMKCSVNYSQKGISLLRTVLLKGNVALARNFLSSRRNHSIEQRVGRVASQVNTRLDTLEFRVLTLLAARTRKNLILHTVEMLDRVRVV